jgi:hypothetical protein
MPCKCFGNGRGQYKNGVGRIIQVGDEISNKALVPTSKTHATKAQSKHTFGKAAVPRQTPVIGRSSLHKESIHNLSSSEFAVRCACNALLGRDPSCAIHSPIYLGDKTNYPQTPKNMTTGERAAFLESRIHENEAKKTKEKEASAHLKANVGSSRSASYLL